MKYSSRFWLYAPLCLLLGLAAFVAGHWWRVASAFDDKLAALKGHDAMAGIVIDWQSKTVSGFPFRIDAVFTGLSLKGAGARGPFAWQSEKFALHALTYGRNQQIFEAGGRQRLSWTDGARGAHDISFLPAQLHASAICDAKGLARFDLDILDAGGKDSTGNVFTAGRLQFHMRRGSRDTIDLAASAEAVKNAAGMTSFGTAIPGLRASIVLNRGAALAPLLVGEMSWPDAHTVWQKAQGSAHLEASAPAAGQPLARQQAATLERLLASLY